MNFSLTSLVIDAAEPEAESGFWNRLLGGTINETATHHFVQVDGLPVIVIQHAPGQQPPRWPDGSDQQLHFDLSVTDLTAADQRVQEAGGCRLRPVDDASVEQESSRVYASPAGHPFCLRAER